MLEKFMILFISAAALVIVCWILAEYWLRSVRKLSVEKISNLSIWNRMVYAFEDFCGGVNHKKDLRRMRIGEELGSVHRDEEIIHYRQAETRRKEDCRDKDIFKKERKYKMKANM